MDQPPRGSRRVLLLDTSAFISGYEMLDASLEHITVPEVAEELREGGLTRLRLENAQRSGRLKIFSPEPKYLKEVEAITLQLGERGVLSAADKQLLALGLQWVSRASQRGAYNAGSSGPSTAPAAGGSSRSPRGEGSAPSAEPS